MRARDQALDQNKEAGTSQLPCDFGQFSGGSDEIRTRDLRRDRPAF